MSDFLVKVESEGNDSSYFHAYKMTGGNEITIKKFDSSIVDSGYMDTKNKYVSTG